MNVFIYLKRIHLTYENTDSWKNSRGPFTFSNVKHKCTTYVNVFAWMLALVQIPTKLQIQEIRIVIQWPLLR